MTARRASIRKLVVSLVAMMAIVVLNVEARADTITFGDFTSGPSDTLYIDGATVSGYTGLRGRDGQAGVPATVPGEGLGSALIGPNYTIDRLLSFEAGSWNHTSISELLQISVAGTINSLTLDPYFAVLGPDPVAFPFEIHFATQNGQPPLYFSVDPSDANPVTITFPILGVVPSELLFIGVGYDSVPGSDGYIYDYLRANGYPAMTFQMGFTITALDYTPVPEPATVILLCTGLAGLGIFRRAQGRARRP